MMDVMGLVDALRTSVMAKIDKGSESSVNKKKLVQRSVQEALVELLEPERKAYVMDRKKKSNIILFVGLQGENGNGNTGEHNLTSELRKPLPQTTCAQQTSPNKLLPQVPARPPLWPSTPTTTPARAGRSA